MNIFDSHRTKDHKSDIGNCARLFSSSSHGKKASLKLLTLLFGCALLFTSIAADGQHYDTNLYSGMQWRLIGPHRAGRVTAVAGIPGQPAIYYMGTPGGGVWKTTDGGRVWKPIFDDAHVASIGALALVGPAVAVLFRMGLMQTTWISAPIAGIVFALLGAMVAYVLIPAQTVVQQQTPDALRGRVLSIQYMASNGLAILPLLFVGALADLLGIPSVLMLLAIALVWGGCYSLLAHPASHPEAGAGAA